MFIRKSEVHGRSYLSVAKKVKKSNGQWRTKIVAGLGYVDDLKEYIPDPREYFSSILKKIEAANKDELENGPIPLESCNSKKNLGYGYIKYILIQLHIDEFFREKQIYLDISYNLFDIFSMLVYSQIIHPGSVEYSYIHSCEFFENNNYELYDVYRALSFFTEYSEELLVFIYNQLGVSDNDNMKNIYYDESNVYFEIDEEDEDKINMDGILIREAFRTFGFSKENRLLSTINFHVYRKLSLTEEDFKILKSYFQIRSIYLQTPDHIFAHILIAIIALQSVRILQFILDRKYPIHTIFESLRDFNAYEIETNMYFIPYTLPLIEDLKEKTGLEINNRIETQEQIISIFSKKNISVVSKPLNICYW